MLSFRNPVLLGRLAARGRTLFLLGLVAVMLVACGPGGGRVGY
jgi:hypothetical protein